MTVHRESIEWSDVWVTAANRTDQRRVLLVGDSIARSYYDGVNKLLSGRLACARLANSKCVCMPAFERELKFLLDDFDFAAIHFNNGLHGWDYTEAEYAAGLRSAFKYLRRRSPGGALIWASTTPVRRTDDLAKFDPRTERVKERNRIAADLCRRHGLPTDDLFALVQNRPDCYAPDGVHFNAQGQALLAGAVAQSIMDALNSV